MGAGVTAESVRSVRLEFVPPQQFGMVAAWRVSFETRLPGGVAVTGTWKDFERLERTVPAIRAWLRDGFMPRMDRKP